MRTTKQVAHELLKASLKCSDDLGIPSVDEELAYLMPLVEARDHEVASAVLDSLDLALGLEAEGHTGQSLFYYTRARKLATKLRESFTSQD